MSILEFLGLSSAAAADDSAGASETQTVRKIIAELDGLPQDQAKFIASFAFILSRVASADQNISAEESAAMELITREIGGLSEQQAILVVQMAKTQSRLFGGTENFTVTQEFNQTADREQKMKLLECLFAVSSADDEISSKEDHACRQIADELLLDHADYIAVRSRFREHLSVLRKRK